MTDLPTNIQIIKPSRKKPQGGDIFAIRLPDGSHLFGRVIDADIKDPMRAPMPGAYLIYVYAERSASMEPDLSALTTDRLLLPPVFINKMPWTKGYFATVHHVAVESTDRLARHCFWSAGREIYVDENRRPLPHEVQPCGDWGLSSYRWLDDHISDALGIPRVPEGA
ncbi:immunity 26/phosphotriesterase HocA family protein [Calidifontibacter indicus]|uniref:immunity 26/phosphotriesterase HocA family protein n=1 Tax=Calidifontibacter indicus TaxID=419650 RepID=UPI003D762AB1